MGTVDFLVLDGNSVAKNFAAEQQGAGNVLTLHSAPEIEGEVVSQDNPMPVSGGAGSEPVVSLDAATAPGNGGESVFASAKASVAMQVTFTGGPTALTVQLEGTINMANWFPLATFDMMLNNSGDIVAKTGFPVIAGRARLATLTGGVAPTVTATLLAA